MEKLNEDKEFELQKDLVEHPVTGNTTSEEAHKLLRQGAK